MDTPSLVSVSTSKKEKQSLKPLSQDEQSCLEKIIKKIIEEVLNEKNLPASMDSENEGVLDELDNLLGLMRWIVLS
ncbi:25991_t:CDS:2 [Racocetra persica]|uniref:25991_t:CDS:1 n=1 Tax=Racocetra persica TaxID=160502 RepID=A0ACA9M0B8_9GLOM|nr:25991_t:CDS:2 [Racocetra persica]